MPPAVPMPMICGMPWPMTVMIVSRPRNDIRASTRRCTAIELLENLGVLVKETNTF